MTVISKVGAKTVQKAFQESQKLAKPLDNATTFKDLMKQADDGKEFAKSLGMNNDGAAKTIETIDAKDVAFDAGDLTSNSKGPDGKERFVEMLGEINKGQMHMDQLVNHVLYSGKKFTNQEMLVIQAHVYHYAQMTEMTVKVAEQGVNSVKTVLNTQVQ